MIQKRAHNVHHPLAETSANPETFCFFDMPTPVSVVKFYPRAWPSSQLSSLACTQARWLPNSRRPSSHSPRIPAVNASAMPRGTHTHLQTQTQIQTHHSTCCSTLNLTLRSAELSPPPSSLGLIPTLRKQVLVTSPLFVDRNEESVLLVFWTLEHLLAHTPPKAHWAYHAKKSAWYTLPKSSSPRKSLEHGCLSGAVLAQGPRPQC